VQEDGGDIFYKGFDEETGMIYININIFLINLLYFDIIIII
jgi:hypothetical protein